MTKVVGNIVDVVVMRRVKRAWRVLVLRRADGTRSAGSWEHVHGHKEPRERPAAAARRELREETGLAAARLYSVTVNAFYVSRTDTVHFALAFAAVVKSTTVTLGPEHASCRWETVRTAKRRLAWPRDRELLDHVAWLLRSGDAGAVDDVLRS